MSLDYEDLDKELVRILDGWFGEPLAHSENEEQLYRYLYKPLDDHIRRVKQELGL